MNKSHTGTRHGADGPPEDGMRQARRDLENAGRETKDAAREVADEAKRALGEAAEPAKQKTMDTAEDAKHEAETSAQRVANELERAAERCSDEDRWAQEILRTGASSLKTAASYLSANRVDSLVRDGGRLARDNPAAFFGASVATGFLLARLGKTAAARAGDSHAEDFQQSTSSREADTRHEQSTGGVI